MLSIFSCVCQPSVCLLWRNVCLVLCVIVNFPFHTCQHLPYILRCSYVGCIYIYNLCVCFCATTVLDLISGFVVYSLKSEWDSSISVLLSQDCLPIYSLLCVHENLKNCPSFCEKYHCYFDGDWKGRCKLLLFADDIRVYLEKSQRCHQKTTRAQRIQ